MSAERPTILYYRVEDPDYPRNSRVRSYLEQEGYRIDLHRRARGSTLRRMRADLGALFRRSKHAQAIVVSEISLDLVPAAWLVSRLRRIPLIVDGFIGKYETLVVDHAFVAPGSLKARQYRLVDELAIRLSDAYLVDTRMRKDALLRDHPRATVLSLPVGAPDWVREGPITPAESLRLLFYGSYLPLHGIPTIIRALAATGRDDVRLTMVGDAVHAGGTADTAALARELGVEHLIEFLPAVAPERIAEMIVAHDVVLGIFGGSEKAASVIANKVWQGLAAGRVVVTQNSRALAEISAVVGDQLRTVPPEDPEALAEMFRALASDRPEVHEGRVAPLEDYVSNEFSALGRELRQLGVVAEPIAPRES